MNQIEIIESQIEDINQELGECVNSSLATRKSEVACLKKQKAALESRLCNLVQSTRPEAVAR